MEAKDKARELVKMFIPYVDNNSMTPLDAWHNAKQCALKCVDEVVKEVPQTIGDLWRVNNPRFEYWQSVKTEIEKL